MAQITINIPDTALPRIKAALRSRFPSGIDPEKAPNPYPEPTNAEYLAELKAILRQAVIREVKDFEVRSALQNAERAITDIEGIS